jgi:hypothetical protein
MELKGNACKFLVGKHIGRSLLGRARFRGKDNIKLDERVWAELI